MEIINKEIGVHCPTNKLYQKVLDKVENEGIVISPSERDYWKEYGRNMVVSFDDGDFGYGGIQYFKDETNHKIVTAEEYLEGKVLPKKFLVTWDEEDNDPNEYFTTLVEAKKKVTELMKTEEVIKSSVRLVEIKTLWEVLPSFNLKKV